MTAPQDTTPPPDVSTAPLADSVEPAGGSVARLLEGIAERLGGRASVTAVFGEAVTREGVTVIPVAKVGFGFGGGILHGLGRAKSAEGGGGGGGCEARPLGFIELRDGTATYHPIRDPWADVVAPLAALLATAAGPVLIRALTRRRKS